MKRLTPERPRVRRALIADIGRDKKGWLQHGVAALAVSVLGLGVAGSVALTGAAQDQQSVDLPQTQVSSPKVATGTLPNTAQGGETPAVEVPEAFARRGDSSSRSTSRDSANQANAQSKAEERADELKQTQQNIVDATNGEAADKRNEELSDAQQAAKKNALSLQRQQELAEQEEDSAPDTNATDSTSNTELTTTAKSTGSATTPLANYTIAARYGAVGSWSRYHTGIDFSAAIGTTIRAADTGVVTNAGYNGGAGWAGFYVSIRHADGTSSLYAHMSGATVSVGQTVGGGQTIGSVGMTGRTFGPHTHFEIYPAGATPGTDPYKAVDPSPWFSARGVRI